MAKSVRVLHIDDEPDFADLTASFLERRKDRISVQTATSVASGLDQFAVDQFDCIVSDYEMPEMNGLEFLRAVRADHPNLPFILFTGKGSEEIAAEAISAGVTDYIQKGAGTSQYTVLENRIMNAVQARRVEQQVARDQHAMNEAWDGIGMVDEDGKFTHLNDAYAAAFRYEREELIGKHWKVVYPDDSREIVTEEILPAVRENGTWTGETTLVRSDGTEFIGEHTVASVEGGGSVCVLRDRSERHELDKSLRYARERYRLLVEATDEYAMFILDSDGCVTTWNAGAERIKGYSESEIKGTHISVFYTEKAVEEGLPDRLLETAAARGKVTDQGRRVRKDGSTFWADVTITALRENGTLRGFAKVTKDITPRIEREKRMERNEAYRKRLYEISTDTQRDFDEKVVEVLQLGADYLDVEHGHLVSIDPDTDRHEILAVSGDHPVISPGAETSLSETYCRRTIDGDHILSVYNALDQGWEDDPAYRKYGLGCYIGAKIEIEGELFGTVCFVDRESRSEPFTYDEKTFIELLTRWLTLELDRRDRTVNWPLTP